jgi:hypothetical protein
MEEDREFPSDDDSIDEFINRHAHYSEVEDLDYWIHRNKLIRTRWQMEKAFMTQLEEDMTLHEIFDIVINKREHTSNANTWFSSGIMTIDRAFDNRFDMACELVGRSH